MRGAKGVLINITGGYDMTLFEVDEAANEVRREVDVDAHIILGSTFDEKMVGKIRVSVVAAGLQQQAAASARPAPHAGARTDRRRSFDRRAERAVAGRRTWPAPSAPAPSAAGTSRRCAATAGARWHAHQPAPIIRPRPADAGTGGARTSRCRPPAPTACCASAEADDHAAAAAGRPEAARRASRSPRCSAGRPSRRMSRSPALRPGRRRRRTTFDDELEIPAFLRRSANT